MQDFGYILVNGQKMLVLWRLNQRKHKFATDSPGYVAMKLRKSGRDGIYLQAESEYLAENPDTLAKLQQGIVIKL